MRNDVRGLKLPGDVSPNTPWAEDGGFVSIPDAAAGLWPLSAATAPQAPPRASPEGTTSSGAGAPGVAGVTSTVASANTSSPFVINISWDTSVASAPTAFTNAVLQAVQYLESQFTDAVTMNIAIGYGEVGGSTLGSNALGSSGSYFTSFSYTQLLNALASDSKTSTDAMAVASLPATSPVSGTFWTTTAQAKALGLSSASTALDGYAGFSSTLPFTYDNSGGVAGGTYDFFGVALHELTELMGRSVMNGSIWGTSAAYEVLDLFHYSAAGVRDWSASTPGYFSVDSGVTNLANFNTSSGGDAGDWASSVTNDAADAFSSSGVINAFSATDVTVMDAIGWDLAGAASSTPPPTPTPLTPPTGVAVSAAPAAASRLQGGGSLAARTALATVTPIGGATGDSYMYAVGGSAAGAFALSTSGNVGTLATGAGPIAGADNGSLYGLTVTVTDTTIGQAAPATALDVIVGAAGNDTIQVAALGGSLTVSTPTFIFGMAGADRINGTDMSGSLWIIGGAGADVMTGGSGANDYLYGAAGESTVSALDIITNFKGSLDMIDLTGLGTALRYVGQLSNNISGHSIGWQVSGGNTFVYVNTGSPSQKLGATSMKIELQGSVSLSDRNFAHL
jgi:hypothetical protein